MRHRLTFQRPVQSSDGLGAGGTITWTDAMTVWAERWSIKSSERVEAARAKQNTIYRWHVRYNPGIIPSMRIKWVDHGRTHYQEVLTVNPLNNENVEMEVFAEEKI
jgi:SPP1 family predicted phage head-tail adaptor